MQLCYLVSFSLPFASLYRTLASIEKCIFFFTHGNFFSPLFIICWLLFLPLKPTDSNKENAKIFWDRGAARRKKIAFVNSFYWQPLAHDFFFSYRNCNMMILCNCLHILESLWAVALWYHTAGAKNSFCFFPKATTKLLRISLQNNQHFVGRSLYYFVIVLVGKKNIFLGSLQHSLGEN